VLDLLSDLLPLLIEPGKCRSLSGFSGGGALAEFINQRFGVTRMHHMSETGEGWGSVKIDST
jgi:hypothetical protein